MQNHRVIGIFALAAIGVTSPAIARNQCRVPDKLPKIRAEFPPPGNAVNAPVTGYQLAMSWTPQFCKENGKEKEYAPRCKDQKFGFVLDSFRADGPGRENPVYCKRMGPVPETVARRAYCAMPSVKVMSHAWAKYGSCFANDAASYFETGTAAFAALKWPDMNALSQTRLDVAGLLAAITAVNPGLSADMFSVRLTPLGWLEELRFCLDTQRRPRPCPVSAGGAGMDATVRIWPSY